MFIIMFEEQTMFKGLMEGQANHCEFKCIDLSIRSGYGKAYPMLKQPVWCYDRPRVWGSGEFQASRASTLLCVACYKYNNDVQRIVISSIAITIMCVYESVQTATYIPWYASCR